MKSNRRTFVIQSVMSAGILATTRLAQAQAPAPLVQETDPQAVALGYKNDAAKADKVKYPKYAVAASIAPIARFTKARRLTRLRDARCLPANKWPPKPGAAPGPKRLDAIRGLTAVGPAAKGCSPRDTSSRLQFSRTSRPSAQHPRQG